MKETAVEWLIKQMNNNDFIFDEIDIQLFDAAKEMERQQLKDCWHSSDENMRSQFSSSNYKRITFEQWLNQQ